MNQISHMKQRTILLITTIYLFSSLIAGVTGKISGRITDEVSGEPLIGANILLQGTSTGAATDIEGYYHIMNVSPGLLRFKDKHDWICRKNCNQY